MDDMIDVLLVEDHTLMRQGTRALLGGARDIRIVAETGDGAAALALAAQLRPHVALLDIRLAPGPNGVEVARGLRRDSPDVKVLMLTAHAHEVYVRRLMAIGVHGYLLKSASDTELIAAIRAAHGGQHPFSPEIKALLTTDRRGRVVVAGNGALSEREREVLEHVCAGRRNKEIADLLGIQESTVETHVHNIMARLEARTRGALITAALEQGLGNPQQ